jgi:transposase
MAKMIGPRKVRAYGDNFKATAVKLSNMPGVQVQDVAEALDIHPFMLSRWRKEYREGRIVSTQESDIDLPSKLSELQRLRQLEKEHALLKEEHALLKKAIRFCSERRQKSTPSSSRTVKNTY